jgi:hypothetical protein
VRLHLSLTWQNTNHPIKLVLNHTAAMQQHLHLDHGTCAAVVQLCHSVHSQHASSSNKNRTMRLCAPPKAPHAASCLCGTASLINRVQPHTIVMCHQTHKTQIRHDVPSHATQGPASTLHIHMLPHKYAPAVACAASEGATCALPAAPTDAAVLLPAQLTPALL